MSIREITEDEFDEITGGGLMNAVAAILCESTAITWLADESVVGVLRCDTDLGERTYSWAVYRRSKLVRFAHDLPYYDGAMAQCMRCMRESA